MKYENRQSFCFITLSFFLNSLPSLTHSLTTNWIEGRFRWVRKEERKIYFILFVLLLFYSIFITKQINATMVEAAHTQKKEKKPHWSKKTCFSFTSLSLSFLTMTPAHLLRKYYLLPFHSNRSELRNNHK